MPHTKFVLWHNSTYLMAHNQSHNTYKICFMAFTLVVSWHILNLSHGTLNLPHGIPSICLMAYTHCLVAYPQSVTWHTLSVTWHTISLMAYTHCLMAHNQSHGIHSIRLKGYTVSWHTLNQSDGIHAIFHGTYSRQSAGVEGHRLLRAIFHPVGEEGAHPIWRGITYQEQGLRCVVMYHHIVRAQQLFGVSKCILLLLSPTATGVFLQQLIQRCQDGCNVMKKAAVMVHQP